MSTSIIVSQPRGNPVHTQMKVYVEETPRVGEWFELRGHVFTNVLLAGRVEDVKRIYVCSEGGGVAHYETYVFLTGWKHGFGKD